MSAAAPAATAAGDAPAKKGKKKLIIIVVAAVVLLALIGGGVMFYLKSKAAAADAEQSEDGAAPDSHAAAAKPDAKTAPSFLPLDPFVVNLADKDADRYAQIGITLEVDAAPFAEQMKAYMPAVRNAILMILAHKTSAELLERKGKEALAAEIMREAVRPMGIEIEPEDADDDDDAAADAATATDKPKKRKKKKKAVVHNPVRNVHFSNFIIQ